MKQRKTVLSARNFRANFPLVAMYFQKLLLVAAATLSSLQCVRAHGFMTKPAPRNINDYNKQSLAAGGPGTVNAGGGYRHGMCGNAAEDSTQNWNAASFPTSESTYISGQELAIEITITAHHLGFFEFDLCDSPDISETCFRSNRLLRSNCNVEEHGEDECRKWWKPPLTTEVEHYSFGSDGYPLGSPIITGCGDTSFTAHFKLPEDLSCTHCVLRWHWYTTNSCTNPAGDTSEEFWNCADIRIDSVDGAADTINTSVGFSTQTELEALNERLTGLVPEDLLVVDGGLTDADNYRCPVKAHGDAHEYSCAMPGGSANDTSACRSECGVEFYGGGVGGGTGTDWSSPGGPLQSYCSFNGICEEISDGPSEWCDTDKDSCSECNGKWCVAKTTEPTNTVSESPEMETTATESFVPYCSFTNTCALLGGGHSAWCDSSADNCGECDGGKWCDEFYEENDEELPRQGSAYCSFIGECVSEGLGEAPWCDQSAENCAECSGGMWCENVDTTTSADAAEFTRSEKSAESSSSSSFTNAPFTSSSLRGSVITEDDTEEEEEREEEADQDDGSRNEAERDLDSDANVGANPLPSVASTFQLQNTILVLVLVLVVHFPWSPM